MQLIDSLHQVAVSRDLNSLRIYTRTSASYWNMTFQFSMQVQCSYIHEACKKVTSELS